MRTLPFLLLSLAACGGPSTAGGLGNVGGVTGPAGPAPTIGWVSDPATDGSTFDLQGLPAVSDDGSRVLIGWQQGDGGRGYPNLRLLLVDRADQTLDTRVVLDQDAIDDEWTGQLDVTEHNKFLAESNQQHRWRSLAVATVEGGPELEGMYPSSFSAALGDLAVRFDDGAHLVIEQGGKVVVDTVKKEWLHEDRPMYEGAAEDEICSNPIYLGSVHVDSARRVAVIGVEYYGNDSCWEPTGESHVVTW